MTIEIDTDYLIVGTGAAGMAITDELLAHTDATITLVDRRHAPGGHWIDAYPFVRLHQPSTFYGVTSTPLGRDALDESGTNAGYYELAGADEIRAYYAHVMERRFLPSGRVRYFPSCEWSGDDRFASRLSGASWRARVARRLIDARYNEGTIPATSPPPFEVAEGARCVPAGDVVRVAEPPDGYVIVGGGKTALDTIVFLLERRVPAEAIRWIKPREGWWLNRRFQQPHTMLPTLYSGVAAQLEAMARGGSVAEVFERLEADGILLRIDTEVTPTMFRGAVLGESELDLLRSVRDVVRMGHVRRIGRDEIVLDEGTVPTSERTLHVHCAARGLWNAPLRPIFEPGRMTVQPVLWSFACYQFALLAVVEALFDDDDQKNTLCRPIRYWDRNEDFLTAYLASMAFQLASAEHPRLREWMASTRLNPVSGLAAHRDDPGVRESRERIRRFGMEAGFNLPQLLGR